MAETIALIDYGAGNLHSVYNALRAAGGQGVKVTDDPHFVAKADRIILPGVGAFGACRDALMAIEGMVDAMERRVRREAVPFLGICVGMQLLATKGVEYGAHPGLGWIGGTVKAITVPSPNIKVPHMGWNDVTVRTGAPLIKPGEAYYLHGYHFAVADETDIAATTTHGETLVAAVARDTILGVQFHPEKSQRYGLQLMTSFLAWRP